MLNRILFKLYAFFFGFRFYITTIDPSDKLFNEVSMTFTFGTPLQFQFYKTEVEYTSYRLGKMKTMNKVRYGVSTTFDDPNHPELVSNYSNKLMSVYIPFSYLLSIESLSKYLLEIFIDFMFDEIKKSGSSTQTKNTVSDNGERRRVSDHSLNKADVPARATPRRRFTDQNQRATDPKQRSTDITVPYKTVPQVLNNRSTDKKTSESS